MNNKIETFNGVDEENQLLDDKRIDNTKKDLSILLMLFESRDILRKYSDKLYSEIEIFEKNDNPTDYIDYFINSELEIKKELYNKFLSNNIIKEDIDYIFNDSEEIKTIKSDFFINVNKIINKKIYPDIDLVNVIDKLIDGNIIKNINDMFYKYSIIFNNNKGEQYRLNYVLRMHFGKTFKIYMNQLFGGIKNKSEIFKEIEDNKNLRETEKEILKELLNKEYKANY